ncbi:MAG: hypothetical protein J6W43_01305 [Prevotella sp.]|nr:hypothetical protein [Prevotella sp.]
MKKNSILVKMVLMSALTVGTMFGFTACSDDSDLMNNSENSAMEKDYNGPALAPLGICFQDFITPNDVQILDADTTQISVSKALADKLGIQSFVGHPMGIWQDMEEDSYMRKAVKEQLVGDRYILNVVPASLAELLNGQNVRLSSDLYVNTDAQAVRSRAASENIPEYAAKYIDENNMIHPVAVTILPSANGEQNPTRSGISAFGTFSTEDIMMARMSGSRWWPWSEIKKAAKAVYDWTKDKTTYNIREYDRDKSLVQVNTEFSKKIEFGAGKKNEKKDTFNVNVKVPIDFALNYTFILDASGSLVSLPNMNRFETSVSGTFDFAPQVTLGFSKKFEIPDDKQRLKLYDFPTVKLKFTVGPVPVTIDIQPYLFLKFEAEVSGSAYLGVKYHYASHFKFGAAYTNGWNLIKSYDTDENKVTMIPPTGQFKAHAGVGLMLGCDVIVEKLAGPKIAIGPKLTADAELKFSPDVNDCHFKSSVDFGVVGEIGAKLKVWKWELADWQTEVKFGEGYNIFHYNFPHEEGDEANGSFDNVLRLLNPYKNL